MTRVNIQKTQPNAYAAMFGLEKYLSETTLPPRLIELIKTRSSQINGCAFCIQMHSQSAQAHGESAERLLALSAWKESPLFSDNERAVLALTEEVTLISHTGVRNETYSQLSHHFDEIGIAQLIMTIATINAWNRIAIATHVQ